MRVELIDRQGTYGDCGGAVGKGTRTACAIDIDGICLSLVTFLPGFELGVGVWVWGPGQRAVEEGLLE